MNVLSIAGVVGNTRGVNQVGDKQVLNFSLAVKEGRDRTTWFDCAIWGERASKLEPYIEKGGRLAVTGSVDARAHDGKAYLTVFVRDLTFMSARQAQAEKPSTPEKLDDFDDDIPF